MLTNSSHPLYTHIQNLVQALNNKKSSNSAKNELVTLIETIGVEAEKYTLSCLLETIDFKELKNSNGKKDQLKVQFLAQRISVCTESEAFLDYFAEVIPYHTKIYLNEVLETTSQKNNATEAINDLMKNLKLSIPVQIIMSLSLAQSSNQSISKEGISLLKKKLIEFCRVGKAFQFSENTLNDLLYLIRTCPHFENMKKEVTFLIDTNSAGRSSEFRPLLTGNTENIEVEMETSDLISDISPNAIKVCELMKDLGPTCTQSPEVIERLLSDFPTLDENDILDTLLLMSNNSTCFEDRDSRALNYTYGAIKTHDWSTLLSDNNTKEGNTVWKVNNFLEVCNKRYKIDWSNIISMLDRPNLYIKDPQALIFLFKAFQRFKKIPNFQFPTTILFEKWNNYSSQIDFLIKLIQAGQPDVVSFAELPKRNVSPSLYPSSKLANLNPPALLFFACIDILELLIEFSESDYVNEIRSLFDLPLEKNPDLLMSGLLEVKPQCGIELMNELYSCLLTQYVSNYKNSAQILEKVYKTKPRVLIAALAELSQKDESLLTPDTALNIIQEVKGELSTFLDCDEYKFAVNLAVAAANQDQLNLEEWLLNKIKSVGNYFVTAILKYFTSHIFKPCRNAKEGEYTTILEKSHLSLDLIVNVLRILSEQNTETVLSHQNKGKILNLNKELNTYFPGVESEVAPTGADLVANSLIEKIFDGSSSPQELLDLIIKYKESEDEKERDIATYTISNLLDESRFFSTYKNKMLLVMAQLYGTLIKQDVVEGKTRDLAFLIILDMVRQKESRKLFEFGVNALLVFRERLYEWPTKAAQLFYVDNLKNFSLELLEQIYFDLTSNNVEVEIPEDIITVINLRNQKGLPNGENSENGSISVSEITNSENDPNAVAAAQSSPRQITLEDIVNYFDKEAGDLPEDLKTKITTAVNNCSETNLFQKALEIKSLLKDDNIIYWFSRRLISQKAHKEASRHETLISLVEKIGKKEIFGILTKETYVLFSHVLSHIFNSSEKAVLSAKDKNILKNLGSWLGLITIGRNKPIILKEFDVKTLIVTAHENKKLDSILPLICKILLQGNQTGSVFKPNNAWMNAILSILAEIAEMQDIKMALKYEIQMLFRNLNLSENEITPSKLFQSRKLRKKNQQQQQQNHQPGSIEPYLNTEELVKFMKVNTGALKGFTLDIDFRTLSAHALTGAIKKTLPNVSDASTLALITSKRLVLKDFATEPDEKNLLHGLELTIQSLAENLTLVTSKRPLAENFQQALEEQLNKYNIDNKDKIIETIIASNLDVGCAIIRNAVVREALGEAGHDPEILQAIEKRKISREKGIPVYDGTSFQIWTNLPDLLKPNLRGLSREELKIYEGFINGGAKRPSEDN